MIIKSYSKINLSLRIKKKLKNKLHDIQSNYFLLELHDRINIKKIKSKKDIIVFKGKFKKGVNKINNSVIKSVELLKKYKILKSNYKIRVEKNIPVFSGMGGGTSNAYFIFKYFLKKNYNKKLITIFEKSIGTDFKIFFLNQGYQISLKKIKKYKKLYNFYVLLVYPYIECSTKEVYSLVRHYRSFGKIKYENIRNENNFINSIKVEQNDLQNIVSTKHPLIKKLIEEISLTESCCLARMSGSGSTCFGLFKSKKMAKNALGKIRKKFPNFWYHVTKTI